MRFDIVHAVADAVEQWLQENYHKYTRYPEESGAPGVAFSIQRNRWQLPLGVVCYETYAILGETLGGYLHYEYNDPRFPDNLYGDVREVFGKGMIVKEYQV